jgi:SAM-dependent methyltransferase
VSKPSSEKPDYGNWVPAQLLVISGAVGVVLLGLSLVFSILIVGAVVLLLLFAYFAYARYRLSYRAGELQARIQNLVIDHLSWDGQARALDIGCGNAPLTVKLAKEYPDADVVGIDTWGGLGEYSRKRCERNAELEGVADRVSFQQASAAALPFADGSFDAVVSNLVFHEVKDARDKADIIKEALRVVKKGGGFAFQDLFLSKRLYGEADDLLEKLRDWGIQNVGLVDTGNLEFIPRAAKLPFMLGGMGVLFGRK